MVKAVDGRNGHRELVNRQPQMFGLTKSRVAYARRTERDRIGSVKRDRIRATKGDARMSVKRDRIRATKEDARMSVKETRPEHQYRDR